jgi:hypothetical protein
VEGEGRRESDSCPTGWRMIHRETIRGCVEEFAGKGEEGWPSLSMIKDEDKEDGTLADDQRPST